MYLSSRGGTPEGRNETMDAKTPKAPKLSLEERYTPARMAARAENRARKEAWARLRGGDATALTEIRKGL